MRISPALQSAFDAAERRDRFWSDNYGDLLDRYPEQFVAVKDCEVVAAESSFEELLKAIRARGLSPQADVWMQWISKSMACLVL